MTTPVIDNFPYQYNIPGPTDDSTYWPQYMEYLCKAILQATDFTQLPDSPVTNKQAFATYREQIRVLMNSQPKTLEGLPVCPPEEH